MIYVGFPKLMMTPIYSVVIIWNMFGIRWKIEISKKFIRFEQTVTEFKSHLINNFWKLSEKTQSKLIINV